ncbi:V-set and immunoglobulin domain-containing protein 10-like [Pyxicephalus adspersus]|uniref:V-set and immunoglobulin domain-containing protein 10-like n=1 Tax=Pyxicephalus adspersus TaxID=30357 RepID=UPI003B594B14
MELNPVVSISIVLCAALAPASCEVEKEINDALNPSVAKPPESLAVSCIAKAGTGGALLICSWTGGQPAADIELSFNGTVDRGQNYVERGVNLDYEVQQPELVCQGKYGEKTSKCQTIFERPLSMTHDNNTITSVKEGENIKLTVSLTSKNSLIPEYTWVHLNPDTVIKSNWKYQVKSSSSGSTLLISSVKRNENGVYECRARNIIGTTIFKFNLKVKSKGSRS